MGYPPITGGDGGGGGSGDATSLRGTPISTTSPSTNDVLLFDGSSYTPSDRAGIGSTVTASNVALTFSTDNRAAYRKIGGSPAVWTLPPSTDLFTGWETTVINESVATLTIAVDGSSSDTIGATSATSLVLPARSASKFMLNGTNFAYLDFGFRQQGIVMGFPSVVNNTYFIALRSPFNGIITQTTTRCESGTATGRFQIDGTNVGQFDHIISSTENNIAHSTANNLFFNQDLTLVITNASSVVNLAISVRIQ